MHERNFIIAQREEAMLSKWGKQRAQILYQEIGNYWGAQENKSLSPI